MVEMDDRPALFTEPKEILEDLEYRVLSKAASGGRLPRAEEVASMVISAGPFRRRCQVGTGVRHRQGRRPGRSRRRDSWHCKLGGRVGAITPSDDTITQVNLGAFKANTKMIATEELRDAEVDLDRFLAVELGGRIGLSRLPLSRPGTVPANQRERYLPPALSRCRQRRPAT